MIGGFSIDFYLKNIDTINFENTLELVFKFLFIRIDFIFFRGLFVLYFLDFEYFGWDDPIKLICDFFWHPGNNVSKKLKNRFLNKTINLFSKNYKNFKNKLYVLLPLYGLRWCLIILNCFVKKNHTNKIIETQQLKKAQKILNQVSHYGY